jgi:hypothetical protein
MDANTQSNPIPKEIIEKLAQSAGDRALKDLKEAGVTDVVSEPKLALMIICYAVQETLNDYCGEVAK